MSREWTPEERKAFAERVTRARQEALLKREANKEALVKAFRDPRDIIAQQRPEPPPVRESVPDAVMTQPPPPPEPPPPPPPRKMVMHPIQSPRVDQPPPVHGKWTWLDLPRDARKASRIPAIPDSTPVYQDLCNNCRQMMWTRSPREDICETCEFVLIDEKHRMRKERENSRGGLVNPFGAKHNAEPVMNPLRGGRGL